MAPTTNNHRISAAYERRRKPRVFNRFITSVSGVNASGEPFEVETALDNLSAGGLYIRLRQRVNENTKLKLLIHLAESRDVVAPVVETQGIVLRSEPKLNGEYGIAVKFTRHRFRDIGERTQEIIRRR
jgi:hypothetical protein